MEGSSPLYPWRRRGGRARSGREGTGTGKFAESSAFLPASTSHATFGNTHPAVVGLGSRSFKFCRRVFARTLSKLFSKGSPNLHRQQGCYLYKLQWQISTLELDVTGPFKPETSEYSDSQAFDQAFGVRTLKRRLHCVCGVPRFRQRLLHGQDILEESRAK